MILLIPIAVAMIILCRRIFPDIVRFDLKAYRNFLLLCLIGVAIKIFSIVVLGRRPSVSPDLFQWPLLFFVFWEDMFFVFPSILLYTLTKNKYLVALLILVSSVIFSLGHVYQGIDWALFLLAYVPIMFFVGRKHGLGTVMAGHVTYDVLNYLIIYMASLGCT
jgi:hypothetical protein